MAIVLMAASLSLAIFILTLRGFFDYQVAVIKSRLTKSTEYLSGCEQNQESLSQEQGRQRGVRRQSRDSQPEDHVQLPQEPQEVPGRHSQPRPAQRGRRVFVDLSLFRS